MPKICLLVLFILILFCTPELDGQNQSVKAYRMDQTAVIDGKLDESFWQEATPFTDFRMVEPTPGKEPSEKTELKVVYSRGDLFLGIRCFDSDPQKISANSLEHDRAGHEGEDLISILIDPFHDKRTAYIFIVNSRGARSEGFASGEHSSLSWDGLWEARCHTHSQGWTAEIRIPFKTISFNKNLTSWGFNIERQIARKQEIDRYSGISLNSFFSNPAEAGVLEGIQDIEQGLGLTFRPYGLVKNESNKSDTGYVKQSLTGGFDLYKNLAPNLVAAITYNTDFAETEVDERKLNITRFPLYYPEKRTFFLEGSDIFDFVGSTESFMPFFSRRIGLNNGVPVPIQWGTKVFGKVANTNVAVLDVQTQHFGAIPSQNMFATRISQNILKESKIGIIATNGDPSGKKNNLIGGDFIYKTSRFLGSDNFSVGLWGVQNQNEHHGGNKNAMGFKIDYPNDLFDINLGYNFMGDSIDPGLGFLPRNAYRYLYSGISFMPRPEKGMIGKAVRQWFFELRLSNYWNLKGELESRRIFTAPINFHTESGEHIEFNIIPNREVLPADFEISNGVIIPKGGYSFVNYRAEFNTAAYRKLKLDVGYSFGGLYSGTYNDLSAGITLNLKGYVNLGTGTNLIRGNLPQGKFSENVYLTRLNLFITPDLGLSNYLQYDDVSNELGYHGRFFWQIRPGNTIYLVYNNNSERDFNPRRFRVTEDQVILKVQTCIRF